MPKLLTRREAAQYLRVSERTIDRYRRAKLIRTVKVWGIVRLRREDLDNLLQQNTER
jgi:excisionase family DNA binding protein